MNKFYFEYWYNPYSDSFRVTERNPCGCHPDDYLVIQGTRWNETFCWSGVSRRKFLKMMDERGFVNLDKLSEKGRG